jgi:large subunit ribosomal protein L35e
LTFLL